MEQSKAENLMDIGSASWEKELGRLQYRRKFRQTLYSTIGMLITVSAAAVLVAVLLLPVLRIYGTSMTPTLVEGDYVISFKGSEYETGDICCFY